MWRESDIFKFRLPLYPIVGRTSRPVQRLTPVEHGGADYPAHWSKIHNPTSNLSLTPEKADIGFRWSRMAPSKARAAPGERAGVCREAFLLLAANRGVSWKTQAVRALRTREPAASSSSIRANRSQGRDAKPGDVGSTRAAVSPATEGMLAGHGDAALSGRTRGETHPIVVFL
jgi:hypothetical protein